MDLIAAVRYGTRLTPAMLRPEKLDAVDADGSTALHIAVIMSRADAVWSICTSGGCPVITNNSGNRPIDYATVDVIRKIINTAANMQPYTHISML